jgi:hypothetical protein
MKPSRLLAAIVLLAAAGGASAEDFSDHWHDGRAEINGYRLLLGRYGEQRSGYAVLIYVTEPFSRSRRVKVNDHTENPDDTIDVLKLNLVRDFQTGMYDYNTMVSVFSRSSDFDPVKISFTSAEWCGHVYAELLFDPDKVRVHNFSYFEGESATLLLPLPQGAVSEDNLFILLRGLRGDYLGPGESRTVDLIPGVFFSRLAHTPLDPVEAKIERRENPVDITVPAGDFSAMVYDVEVQERKGEFFIEAAYPHRIVRWQLAPDIGAELTGSTRTKYWGLNREGDEKHLSELGIPVYGK